MHVKPPRSLGILLTLLAAILLRLGAARGELWLDEIWAWNAARSLSGIKDLFSLKIQDGHFSLYTLYLSLLGPSTPYFFVRAPALFFGFVSLFLFKRLSESVAPASSTLSLLLFAISYPMVLYASEARGYAPMIAFALAALLSLQHYVESRKLMHAALFWTLSIFAALSHLSAIPYLLAWSAFRGKRALPAFLPLALGASAFYILFLQNLSPGSGPLQSWLDLLVDTLSLMVGGPLTSSELPMKTLLALIAALFALSIFAARLFREVKERKVAALYLSVLLVPVAICLILSPKILVPRYFLLSIVIFQLLLGSYLAALFAAKGAARYVGAIVLSLVILGNLYSSSLLLRYGRASYSLIVDQLLSPSRGQSVLVSGDNDFRHKMMLYFNLRRREASEKIRYVENGASIGSAQWYLTHSLLPYWEGNEESIMRGVDRLKRVECYPSALLSGWGCCLYRKE